VFAAEMNYSKVKEEILVSACRLGKSKLKFAERFIQDVSIPALK
jgi:hypothetical protein